MFKRAAATSLLLLYTNASFGASSEQFQATVNAFEPTVFEQAGGLHFGSILPVAGASCSMDASGTLSGACDSSDANISLGQINISGLFANQAMNISVTGSSSAQMTFNPTSNVTGAASDVIGLGNGVVESIITSASDPNLAVVVYGELSLLEDLQPGTSHTVDFTVTIDFQ